MPPGEIDRRIRVSAVIPAFNEADRVEATLRGVLSIDEVDEVLLVDDGSTDGTAAVARNVSGVRVIVQDRNRGKGAAVNRGVEESRGEILLLLDADLGETAKYATLLLRPILQDDADLTIAVLPAARRPGGFGFVLQTAAWGIRRCTGFVARAPLSGQRAIRKSLLHRIGGVASGFGVEVCMTIDALRAGARVLEVDVDFAHRETGRDIRGFLHRFRQFRHVLRAVLSRMFRPRQEPKGR